MLLWSLECVSEIELFTQNEHYINHVTLITWVCEWNWVYLSKMNKCNKKIWNKSWSTPLYDLIWWFHDFVVSLSCVKFESHIIGTILLFFCFTFKIPIYYFSVGFFSKMGGSLLD